MNCCRKKLSNSFEYISHGQKKIQRSVNAVRKNAIGRALAVKHGGRNVLNFIHFLKIKQIQGLVVFKKPVVAKKTVKDTETCQPLAGIPRHIAPPLYFF